MTLWATPLTWTNGAVTAATMNTEVRDKVGWLKDFADNITRSTAADSGDTTYLRIRRGSDGQVAFEASAAGLGAEFRIRILSQGDIEWGPGNGVVDFYLSRATANRLMLVDANYASQREGGVDRHNFAAFVSGDTQPRVTIGTDVSDRGYISFGPGSGPPDTFLRRAEAGVLWASNGTKIRSTESITSTAFETRPSGDTVPRWQILGSGEMKWGSGSVTPDVNLYRASADVLKTDYRFLTLDGITTKVKSGILSDSDFSGTPTSGTIAVDASNLRLYVRVGTVWRYATLT